MTSSFAIQNATLVLPDMLLADSMVIVKEGRIEDFGTSNSLPRWNGPTFDAEGQLLAPGFIDLHVHGGDGADFMDGDKASFQKVIAAHRRHGTTGLVPTSTVATHDQILTFLELCRHFQSEGAILGAHLYGPYFNEDKVGCHPSAPTRPPTRGEYEAYLQYKETILTATCAPELPGASDFFRDASSLGIRLNAGHSNATWNEMEMAYRLGMRHVDHFYCAMSSVPGLRERCGVPMQASMAEFVLANPEMTTEIIADGCHLAPELLRFVLTMLGPDRTALVTDANRALDMPAGDYIFGPRDSGVPFISDGRVGWTPDRSALASSIRGMDFMVRHMIQTVGVPIPIAVRMATLTPARVLGLEAQIGSIAHQKRADLVLLNDQFEVCHVWLSGMSVHDARNNVR